MFLLTAQVAGSNTASAEANLCADSSKTRLEFFERPWAEIEHSRIGDQSQRVRLDRLCDFSEKQLLEYFVTSKDDLPRVTTEVIFGSREPFERTRLFRSWEFPGVSIHGEVSGDTSICPDRMVLASTKVLLVCGLRVGSSLSDFEASLGEPTDRKPRKEGGSVRYAIDLGVGVDYSIELDVDSDEKISSITWSIPRSH
jgi:hypothetical protein